MSNERPERRGLMLVISSPSGAGKTTLARKLMETHSDMSLSVSATTRAPRPNERDGVDYHFVDTPAFRKMIDTDAFLEWAKVFDHYYGTPRDAVETRLQAGLDVIFDVDWQGADAIHDQMPERCRLRVHSPAFDCCTRGASRGKTGLDTRKGEAPHGGRT